ncbi:MAG: SUMF1/EgtB/PvdO family nonheme iron enzyme [Planctomycetota bacterium]
MFHTRSQVLLSLYAFLAAHAVLAGGPETRLVSEKPVEGRFVETPLGYMVPYQQRIPGSSEVIEMIPVSGGTIKLAELPSDESYFEGKPPQVEWPMQVSFQPFWIGKYEITMGQYMQYRRLYYAQRRTQRKLRERRRWKPPEQGTVDAVTAPSDVYDSAYHFEFASTNDSAAVSMSQYAARHYTKWLSLLTHTDYRLPYRSEWQHACAAGSTGAFCFGDDPAKLDPFAVYFESPEVPRKQFTTKVGRRRPNAWGLYDMHGNVSEFVIEDSAKTGLDFGHVACGGDFNRDAVDCKATSVVRTDIDWWSDDPDFPMSPHWMTSDDARATGFRIISPLGKLNPAERQVAWEADTKRLEQDIESRLESGRGSIGRMSTDKPK